MSAPSTGNGVDARHDRGLQAVRRVREARERDSRLGLARAIEEHRALSARADALDRGLAEAAAEVTPLGSAASYVVQRAHLIALGERLTSARNAAESARRMVETSRDHWMADHRSLESVDSLLARRREARALEGARLQAREDDETSARIWRRSSSARVIDIPAPRKASS